MDTFLPVQPEPYHKLIARSLKLYVAAFKDVFLLALFASFVVFLPRFLIDLAGYDTFFFVGLFNPNRLWLLLINLASILVFIAVIWHMHCFIERIHERVTEDFQIGLYKVLYVFIAVLLQSAVLMAISLVFYSSQESLVNNRVLSFDDPFSIIVTCLIFLGQLFVIVYLYTLFYFLVPLIVVENSSIVGSLKRSVVLVWNHWWRVITVQITPWLTYLIVLLLLRGVLRINLHIFTLNELPHSIWTSLINMLVFALFIPWIAALLLIQLRDLELRHELAYLSRRI